MKLSESYWRYCGESDQTGYFLAGEIEGCGEFQSHAMKGSPPVGWMIIYKDEQVVILRKDWATIIIHADGKFTLSRAESKDMARVARSMGASAVSVHGFVGPDGILACIEAAGDQLEVVVQLELTSPGAEVFNVPLALPMARLASGIGISCVQAPGNRPNRIAEIRSILGPNSTLICCGVGAQGGSYTKARRAGGSYIIVGRAIYESPEPKAAIEAILAG